MGCTLGMAIVCLLSTLDFKAQKLHLMNKTDTLTYFGKWVLIYQLLLQ